MNIKQFQQALWQKQGPMKALAQLTHFQGKVQRLDGWQPWSSIPV